MTILVGVYCKDGVVIGTDSAATFAAGQFKTIEQYTRKIFVVEDRLIVAATGEAGLAQRFVAQVEAAHKESVFTRTAIEVGKNLSARAIADFRSTQLVQFAFGALVAFPCHEKTELCELAAGTLQPELKTENMWFVAMGSGQPIADPFLGFVREVLWHDGLPTHREAAFAVTWAISHAIKLNPGGINAPIQIAVLARDKGKFAAWELTRDEIELHEENVNGMMQHIRAYRETLRNPRDAVPPPEPPKP